MHDDLVKDVAALVQGFYKQQRPFRIYHGSTNSTRPQTFQRESTVDISGLNRILKIDAAQHTAIVEPNVPMDALLKATRTHGLMPPVVMELPGITVGGAIQGMGEESSSYKMGMFHENCDWYEVILGNGNVIKASAETNSDLFYGMPGSYGSLGIITAIGLRLVPATKYVQLTYMPIGGVDMLLKTVKAACNDSANDFVEAIVFSKDRGVIITGKLTDTSTGNLQRFSRARDDWFYLHARKLMNGGVATETVSLSDYLFRYDRGAFWTAQYIFERAGYPFNRFTRWALDRLLHTRKLYAALQETNGAQEYLVQDVAVPYDKTSELLDFLERRFGQYPLWLCPLRPSKAYPLACNNLETELVISAGIWLGQRYVSRDEFIRLNRDLEAKVTDLTGRKWFYAHSYYTEAEFWKIYDRDWYHALRRHYHAETLPNVYEKIISRPQPVKSIKLAAFKTLFGLAKLQIR